MRGYGNAFLREKMKAALDAAPSENSIVGGLVKRLIEKMRGPPNQRVSAGLGQVFGPVPKTRNEARDAGPLYELVKTVKELMEWTTQCLDDFNQDIQWKDQVLDAVELQQLLPELREATLVTRYDIQRDVPFQVQETSLYQLIFVLETRCHLFCFQREWMAIDPEEHVRLKDLPTIVALVPNASPDPFLFMSISALRHACVGVADAWTHFTTSNYENVPNQVETDELTDVIYWLFSRTALLMNNAYDDEIMDEPGYTQQLTEEEFLVNLDFVACVSPFFYKVAQDFEVYGRLSSVQTAPSESLSAFLTERRGPVEQWLRGIIHAATADDLVNKYAQNYCEVEALGDVGASLRTETLARPEFHAHKTIEAHLEASREDQFLQNTIWTFVLAYMFEQQYGDLNFVEHVYYPRINPRDLLDDCGCECSSQINEHPIIVRTPIVNKYVVCDSATTVIGVFEDILSAFLVWEHLLSEGYRSRIRHQDTHQWTDLSTIRSKIERAGRTQMLRMSEVKK